MMQSNSYIGSEVERVEDARLLLGQGNFVGDLSCEGVLHAAILRSSVAHGYLKAIDCSAVRACPGVRVVVTAAEIGPTIPTVPLRQDPIPTTAPYEQPVIANGKVRYVGEPIAVVIADTAQIAEDALEFFKLDIDPLPAVVGAEPQHAASALLFETTNSNVSVRLEGVKGKVSDAFARADYRRRERFTVQRHTAIPMETRGLLARWEGDKLTVWGGAKVPFAIRRLLARHLNRSEQDITIIESDIGGGFGVRGEYYPEDFLVPFCARMVGRPVKWIEDRREHLLATAHAREVECELEIACRSDGVILALRGIADVDMGAYIRTNAVTPPRNIAQVVSGPYRVSNVHMDVALVMTNKTPVGTYRGPGRFEVDFFRERLFDMAAADLGIDRVQFRRINLVSSAEMPYPLPTVMPLHSESECDSGDYSRTLERCLSEFDWPTKTKSDGKLIEGEYHGVALGCYIESGGSGPQENARLAIEVDGTVSVVVGSTAVGQGLETTMAQIAADALELPFEKIRVFHGSTNLLRQGFGTYGSRSIVMGGSAVWTAAAELKKAMAAAAARKLGCSPSEVRLLEGRLVGLKGQSIELGEIAGVAAEGSFGSDKRTYSYGTHAAHVSVDSKTGRVRVLDYVAVEDVGRIVNPAGLHGQTIGAIVQGLGGSLLEHLIYDESGQLLTASFADYLLPTMSDFPNIRAFAMQEHRAPNNPLGAKGGGEGGIIPVGGVIANAVASALRSLGAQPVALPLSPPRVWKLMEDGRSASARSPATAQ